MGRPRILCSICQSYPVTKNKHDDVLDYALCE